MATKVKRVIYSDADCHRLVDIINNYRNIIECKKTDATTWKQKNSTWDKIANIYNSALTEPRTSDQLRCKFDNLKKDVRKYEATKRQNLYKTGGGINESDIKAVIKLLYEKIKSIISFSVNGLEPSQGDSDILVEVDPKECSKTTLIEIASDDCPIILENEMSDEILASTSTSKLQSLKTNFEDNTDWSDYTPKMLKSKKHKVLQAKRKKLAVDDVNEDADSENIKIKMFNLKKELLEKEAAREEGYHEMRMKKEKELYDLKIKNLALQNKKLGLEISVLENM